MENPATWGKAEKVISAAHRQWVDDSQHFMAGLSLARRIADALREAGLIRRDTDPEEEETE